MMTIEKRMWEKMWDVCIWWTASALSGDMGEEGKKEEGSSDMHELLVREKSQCLTSLLDGDKGS
jgi:hypothetical protein